MVKEMLILTGLPVYFLKPLPFCWIIIEIILNLIKAFSSTIKSSSNTPKLGENSGESGKLYDKSKSLKTFCMVIFLFTWIIDKQPFYFQIIKHNASVTSPSFSGAPRRASWLHLRNRNLWSKQNGCWNHLRKSFKLYTCKKFHWVLGLAQAKLLLKQSICYKVVN